MLPRLHREGRKHETERIDQRAENDREPVAPALGDRAEDRLSDAPGEVLHRNGEREFGAWPVELAGDRNLENAEARPDGEAQHQDHGTADQNRREQFGLRHFTSPGGSPFRAGRISARMLQRVNLGLVRVTIARR